MHGRLCRCGAPGWHSAASPQSPQSPWLWARHSRTSAAGPSRGAHPSAGESAACKSNVLVSLQKVWLSKAARPAMSMPCKSVVTQHSSFLPFYLQSRIYSAREAAPARQVESHALFLLSLSSVMTKVTSAHALARVHTAMKACVPGDHRASPWMPCRGHSWAPCRQHSAGSSAAP